MFAKHNLQLFLNFCSQSFHVRKVIAIPLINLLEQVLDLKVPLALQNPKLNWNSQRNTYLLRRIEDQATLLLYGLKLQ